ncbi:MAG: hypothetical protein AB7G28_23360 [Pirellulales bacterium]
MSANTHNEYFTLAGMGGDCVNWLGPGRSAKGTLKAGLQHTLMFSYTVSTVQRFFPKLRQRRSA